MVLDGWFSAGRTDVLVGGPAYYPAVPGTGGRVVDKEGETAHDLEVFSDVNWSREYVAVPAQNINQF